MLGSQTSNSSGRSYISKSGESKIGNKLLYGNHKINIEKFLNNKKSINYSILRLGKTYGDELNDNSIFTSFLKEYIGSKRNFVFAKDQFFNALYVKDLIKVIDFFFKKKNYWNFQCLWK